MMRITVAVLINPSFATDQMYGLSPDLVAMLDAQLEAERERQAEVRAQIMPKGHALKSATAEWKPTLAQSA
jgi:hypothetical protein